MSISISDLPAIDATLNACATVCIIAGIVFIKRGQTRAHIICMATALVFSVAFLVCYITYHYNTDPTRFAHSGWPKVIYFSILITHVPLAALTVPLVLLTVVPALRQRFDRHKRIARWTGSTSRLPACSFTSCSTAGSRRRTGCLTRPGARCGFDFCALVFGGITGTLRHAIPFFLRRYPRSRFALGGLCGSGV